LGRKNQDEEGRSTLEETGGRDNITYRARKTVFKKLVAEKKEGTSQGGGRPEGKKRRENDGLTI